MPAAQLPELPCNRPEATESSSSPGSSFGLQAHTHLSFGRCSPCAPCSSPSSLCSLTCAAGNPPCTRSRSEARHGRRGAGGAGAAAAAAAGQQCRPAVAAVPALPKARPQQHRPAAASHAGGAPAHRMQCAAAGCAPRHDARCAAAAMSPATVAAAAGPPRVAQARATHPALLLLRLLCLLAPLLMGAGADTGWRGGGLALQHRVCVAVGCSAAAHQPLHPSQRRLGPPNAGTRRASLRRTSLRCTSERHAAAVRSCVCTACIMIV